jgi:transaldolase / glucose-6-phosphate isomerase
MLSRKNLFRGRASRYEHIWTQTSEALLSRSLNEQSIRLPAPLADKVAQAQERWQRADNTRRLWSKDAALWTGHDEAAWLGWLDIIDGGPAMLAPLREFAGDVRAKGLSDVLLLGMGGSSLGPEVLAKSLGAAPAYPALRVLDSTDPEQVRRFEASVDLGRTLFIVASKSGTTLEPNALMDYFFARATAAAGSAAASHFVAITDPGSRLQKTAEQNGFGRIFLGLPSIGGRYSVLSPFGLVPLAALGRDVGAFLEDARAMALACGPQNEPALNPGVALGIAIAMLADAGRDKLTLIASPSIAAFGAWVEQLVAESTGKNGRGIIPIADEPLGDPSAYGADRLFVYLRDTSHPDATQDQAVDALADAGHSLVHIALSSPRRLAQEFFRFEFATAVAGAILGINPFDQPDVEASKVATRAMTDAFEKTGALPSDLPVLEEGGIAFYADTRNAESLRKLGAGSSLESWFKAHFARRAAGDYVALLAYLDATDARLRALQHARKAIRDRTRLATSLQFGPRFLHSTGQAHKGGPNSGLFLALTAAPACDLAIPGRALGFGAIEAAQAAGDCRVLGERGRRVLRAHMSSGTDAGLAVIAEAIKRALA